MIMGRRICQSSVSFILKFLNYLQAFVGVAIVLYSLWMLNDWYRHDLDKPSAPWFVYAVMSIGGLLCLIAFTGHIAAGIVNGCCLCVYAVFTSTLILLEAILMGDLIFNEHWEEDLPSDASGHLKSLRAFIEANMDIFKWIAVTLVFLQALSLVLAIILRAMVPPRRLDDGSNDDVSLRNPLLNPHGNLALPSTSAVNTIMQSDSWSSRMRQKYGFVPGPPSAAAAVIGSSNDQGKQYGS